MNPKAPVFSAFADSRTGNRGAVSMLESAIDHLTTDDRNGIMNVFTVYPKDDRQLPSSPQIPIHNGTPLNLVFKLIPLSILYRISRWLHLPIPKQLWGKEMRALINTDVCLMIGGTTFTDAQRYKIPYNIACLMPGVILGKKCMMYSQTLGPFQNWFNRISARWSLGKMDFVAPRGAGSLANVQNLNPVTRVEGLADSAFTLQVPDDIYQRIRAKYAPVLEDKTVVGISPNTIVEKKTMALGIDHNRIWAEFITYLQRQGYFVLLIPHSMRASSKSGHNNDLTLIGDIMRRLESTEQLHVVSDPYNCKELRVVVGLADYYVASRFHSMISALCESVPVSVFGWGFQKYVEVMQSFELPEYCHGAADLSTDALIAGFEQIVADAESITSRIEKNRPAVQQSSMRNHDIAWQLYLESIQE